MEIKTLHEQFIIPKQKYPTEHQHYLKEEIHHNLARQLYKELKGSKNALLVFPPKLTTVDRCNYFGYGDVRGDVEVITGGVNYTEVPTPTLPTNADLNSFILSLILENTTIVNVKSTSYAKCLHCLPPIVAVMKAGDCERYPSPSMTATDVMLKPVCSANGEFLGLVGRCPVCGKIYVSQGRDSE